MPQLTAVRPEDEKYRLLWECDCASYWTGWNESYQTDRRAPR